MSESAGPVDPAPDDHVIRCRVTGADRDALRAFIEESGADVGCRPVAARSGDRVVTYLMIRRGELETVRAGRAAVSVEIEELEDVTASEAAAAAAVARGNRYAARGTVPHGVGRKG